jgi:hypothetical protein
MSTFTSCSQAEMLKQDDLLVSNSTPFNSSGSVKACKAASRQNLGGSFGMDG